MKVKRPVLRYHGGKWKLAPWIISHFPSHRVYVEPFGGAASVLLRKTRSYAEVYNDLDGETVNVFRVLQSPRSAEALTRLLALTPFARAEFELAYQPATSRVERARRTIIRSFMGFGSAAATGAATGFRSCSNRSGTTPAHDWANFSPCVAAFTERLQGVVIENRDAAECMAQHDGPDTLHYVDPPYVFETRSKGTPYCKKHQYRHEMTDEEHQSLAEAMKGLAGYVVVSGYRCELYDDLYRGWKRIDRSAHADGARDRVESLWLNERASAQTTLDLECGAA